jgi:CRP-like cAMP-binding protein
MDTCVNCQYKSVAAEVLNENVLNALHKSCALVGFDVGEIIVKQNALSTNVAYISNGLVKMHTNDGAKEKIIRIVKAPTYLCLPSNISDTVNHFSVTALEPTTVCFLDMTIFRNFICTNGEFAYQIIMELSKSQLKNMHNCINSIQRHTIGNVAQCILSFSKDIYNSDTFTLPISRQDLSEMAGTTRESASRILSELHHENIIKLEGKKITILNEKLLEQICLKG